MGSKKKAAAKSADGGTNQRLRKAVMNEIQDRIQRLEAADGAGPEPGTNAEHIADAQVSPVAGGAFPPAVEIPAEHAGGQAADTATKENDDMRTKIHAKKSESGPKPKRERKAKEPKAPKEPKPKKVSALDAAAKVLSTAKEPLRSQDLITRMEERNLWKSPGGKTPASTLYAAMMREINLKGNASRFKRSDRGLFIAGPGL